MKRFVLLDDEYNDAILYFDSVVWIEDLIKNYKRDMKDAKTDGEDAKYTFCSWLKSCKYVHLVPIQSVYVMGPDYEPEFTIGGTDNE